MTYRNLVLVLLPLLAGCAAQREGLAEALPAALPAIAEGAAGAAALPANPFPWIQIASGLALLVAALVGGKPAVLKLREWFQKGRP